jgi:RNA-directed DNA polymerase
MSVEGRGLGSRQTQQVVRDRGLGNLSTPKSVRDLQMALHAKAKAEAGYRFYALYDKISRDDILAHAYAKCRSNKGAPGVDGQDFADIEVYGVERWLAELALALREKTYRPEPIRRVHIPKANGKLRPLGISTVRDRVCMTAAMLVLEPIFEADLPPEIYAYRAGRNAQQAVVEVEDQLYHGRPDVVDADLADYFGSIPHPELMKSVARRIVDPRVLHLVRLWLNCAVEETDDKGRKTRTTAARDQRCGIPQGSPISPLLANLYMRRFVLGWRKLGLGQRLGARLVTYADDLVILCQKGNAEAALDQMRRLMGQLLFGWYHEQGVSGDRQLYSGAAASVVSAQARESRQEGGSLSTPAPLRAIRARAAYPAWSGRAVGEGVMLCPRAGCREIRMSGSMSREWKRVVW